MSRISPRVELLMQERWRDSIPPEYRAAQPSRQFGGEIRTYESGWAHPLGKDECHSTNNVLIAGLLAA